MASFIEEVAMDFGVARRREVRNEAFREHPHTPSRALTADSFPAKPSDFAEEDVELLPHLQGTT